MKKKIISILPSFNVINIIYNCYLRQKRICKLSKKLALIYNYRILKKYGCLISLDCKIGNNFKCPHPIGIVIGEGVKIGNNVTVYQNVTLGRKTYDKYEYPEIDDNVIIYSNAVVIGNIKIGKNAIIGANSVVLRDVKEDEKVYGIVK